MALPLGEAMVDAELVIAKCANKAVRCAAGDKVFLIAPPISTFLASVRVPAQKRPFRSSAEVSGWEKSHSATTVPSAAECSVINALAEGPAAV
jgi:hypothetical protein